jgi:hypothetical protein
MEEHGGKEKKRVQTVFVRETTRVCILFFYFPVYLE